MSSSYLRRRQIDHLLEERRNSALKAQLLVLVDSIDHHRAQLKKHRLALTDDKARLQDLLRREPQLQDIWEETKA